MRVGWPDRVTEYTEFPVVPHECWIWNGGLMGNGYGSVHTPDGVTAAHRAMYELMVGPIPDGHHLHHECHVRRCVNPLHLRPVLQADHNLEHQTKNFCPVHGPEHADDYVVTSQGARRCRLCHRERMKKYRDRDLVEARAKEKAYRDQHRDRYRAQARARNRKKST